MWKSNRKDECYDVYNDACVECHDKLITNELKTPLNDAIATGTFLFFPRLNANDLFSFLFF